MEINELPALRRSGTRKKRMLLVLKIVMVPVLLGIAVELVYAGFYFYKYNSMLDQITNTDLGHSVANKTKPADSKPMSMLLLGLDTREATGSLNTDVIMAAVFNPKTRSATLVSIPRDTYLKPAGYNENKINAFYSIAKKRSQTEYAAEIKRLIGDYVGISLDYLVVIDFNTFRDVIDALGGITVDVDMDMRYVDNEDGTNINLKKGVQKLDGKQALDFVRYRKSNRGTAESSDFERNQRQQQVLAAIVDKLTSLGGAAKIGGIFDAVGKNIKTDISKEQIYKFITTYITIDNEQIEYIPLEGEWHSPYTYIKPESLQHAKDELRQRLEAR